MFVPHSQLLQKSHLIKSFYRNPTLCVCVCVSVWQWEGDEGRWEPYSPADCVLLDSAVSSGNTSVTLSLGSGTSYEVDLKKMVQVNPVTKYKRKIRSQTVKPGMCELCNMSVTLSPGCLIVTLKCFLLLPSLVQNV